MIKQQGQKQQQCWVKPPKRPLRLQAREGLRGHAVWFGAMAAEGVPWLFFPAPKHCRFHQTPPCSGSGSLPRPRPKGFRVVLSLLLIQAVTATFLELKNSFPCPSFPCGQLKELPPDLTLGKKEKKILIEYLRCAKHCTGCFLHVISFNECVVRTLKALL